MLQTFIIDISVGLKHNTTVTVTVKNFDSQVLTASSQ